MFKQSISIGISLVICLTPCQAEVTTDGSVGPAQDLTGPNFSIGQNLGTLSGANLFHSFSHFNLTDGQSATFTGDAAIQNVISRVTGGEVSSIDGKLISTIGNAGFYFINPAGIVFGQNAKIDVPGAFHASTANELQFADGGKFSANPLAGSSLSMAAPAAFGFLGTQTGTLALNGANFEFKTGATVQFNANNIIMDNAKIALDQKNLNSEGIDLQLAAVGNTAQTIGIKDLPNQALQGDIALSKTLLDASGDGGGRVAVRAGDVSVVDSKVFADNTGDTDVKQGQGIDVQVKNLDLNSSVITSDAAGKGHAGDVTVSIQKTLSMDKKAEIHSNTTATGNVGNVTVKAGTLGMNDGYIWSEGGRQIKVEVDKIQMDSRSYIFSATSGKGRAGDITIKTNGELSLAQKSAIYSMTNNSGNAGQVTIDANKIHMDRGSQIFSSTFAKDSTGNAGNVTVRAGEIDMQGGQIMSDGELINLGSSINSATFSKGNSGQVSVSAVNIQMSGKSQIYTGTLSQGSANDVTINAGTITIDDGSINSTALSESSGNVGGVTVNVTEGLVMHNSGSIHSIAAGGGNTNQVDVTAGEITMDSGASIFTGRGVSGEHAGANVKAGSIFVKAGSMSIDGDGTAISASAQTNNKVAAGDVSVSVKNDLAVVNDGYIASDTFGEGNAGNVIINADNIRLEDGGNVSSDTLGQGDAGKVSIIAHNDLVLLNRGNIGARTLGSSGNAGEVDVNAGSVRIDGNSNITSSAQIDSKGNAGNVKVNARNELVLANFGQIQSSTFSQGNAGTVEVSAKTIRIDGHKPAELITGIGSTAEQEATGSVGSVSVTATEALFMNQGDISIRSAAVSNNSGSLRPNQLIVTAPLIELTDNSKINAASTGNVPASAIQINTHQLTVKDNSQITTSANQGNGGPISIKANDWLFLNNSQITTSVTGKDNGNGGDITLNGDVLVMDSGFIQANTAAQKANGGNINLNFKALVYSQDNLKTGGSTPLTFIPNSGLNVIQAASPTGVNGNINITAPQLNIVGALVGLNNPELDLSRVGHDPCSETVRQSTLKRSGKGGVPLFNKGLDGYTLEHLLETKPDAPAGPQQATHTPNAQQDCKPKPAEKPLQQALTY